MKLKNINGTSDNSCRCGSWLDHWKKHSGQSVHICPVAYCLKKAEVGAHVQKHSSSDNSWYIVPLCKSHNAEKGKSVDVIGTVTLVSANVGQTCGKSVAKNTGSYRRWL